MAIKQKYGRLYSKFKSRPLFTHNRLLVILPNKFLPQKPLFTIKSRSTLKKNLRFFDLSFFDFSKKRMFAYQN